MDEPEQGSDLLSEAKKEAEKLELIREVVTSPRFEQPKGDNRLQDDFYDDSDDQEETVEVRMGRDSGTMDKSDSQNEEEGEEENENEEDEGNYGEESRDQVDNLMYNKGHQLTDDSEAIVMVSTNFNEIQNYNTWKAHF